MGGFSRPAYSEGAEPWKEGNGPGVMARRCGNPERWDSERGGSGMKEAEDAPSWASPLTSQGPPHTTYSKAHSLSEPRVYSLSWGWRSWKKWSSILPGQVHSWEQQKQRWVGQEAGKTGGHAPLGYFRLSATRQVPAWFHFLFYEMNKYAFLASNIITGAQCTSNLPYR